MTVDTSALTKIIQRISDPAIKGELDRLSSDPGIAAIVSQGIADNFAEEGPGWKSLKEQTIKSSLPKGQKKKYLGNNKMKGSDAPARMILQRGDAILKKSVTTVGAQGNIYQPSEGKLKWGSDLVYAKIHNEGGTIQHPGTKKGFGIKGLVIPPHSIPIPKREYLVLRPKYLKMLYEYVLQRATEIVMKGIIKK